MSGASPSESGATPGVSRASLGVSGVRPGESGATSWVSGVSAGCPELVPQYHVRKEVGKLRSAAVHTSVYFY